jgi:hypothetical protein
MIGGIPHNGKGPATVRPQGRTEAEWVKVIDEAFEEFLAKHKPDMSAHESYERVKAELTVDLKRMILAAKAKASLFRLLRIVK